MKLSEELTYRGFVNQTTLKDLTELDDQSIKFYFGVDPSAPSMTIGNLAAAMMVKCFIKHGHQAVLLIGGATGMIGDPDGKAEERSLKSLEDINTNKTAIVSQYHRLFNQPDLTVVDNYDWFQNINYLDFLRDTGKHVPMRQMLNRDFVDKRLSEDGNGISYAEFSYVLIQAYDFLHLFSNLGVTMQVCGSDQWGNCIAGVDLIRRKTGQEANVYSVPLIINQATGQKFGKTEDGAIWLEENMTTPTQFYQFWINVDDQGVEHYLKIYTELDQNQIDEIMQTHNQSPHLRHAQTKLAEEVTKIVHGKEQMLVAQEITEILTGRQNISGKPGVINNLKQEIASTKVEFGGSIIESLVKTDLASSNTEARRLIAANAISINGQKVDRENFEESDFKDGYLLIKRGKAYKDSALIEL